MNRITDRDCGTIEILLMDELDGSIGEAERHALDAHLSGCEDCSRARRDLRESWDALAATRPVEPPVALRERTTQRVSALLADERAGHRARREATADSPGVVAPMRDTSRDWSLVPLAVASALLVAAATMLLLGGLVWGTALPQSHVFFCAATYTGLLVGAFSWIYSATTVRGLHLDAAARIGVIALAITIAATTACPGFHVLAWWDRSIPGRWLTGTIGPGGSSLIFGFAYGLVPGFLAALFGGRMLAERPVANALVAATVVFLLALPVVYLQSAPFTSGLIASWVAGIAAGTLCGVGGAVRVRRRTAGLAT
ncbi:MAG: hypothetical protein RL698_1887 [Pseudomonadota bacterium]